MQDDNEVNTKYNEMLSDERLKGLDKFDSEVSAQMPYLWRMQQTACSKKIGTR